VIEEDLDHFPRRHGGEFGRLVKGGLPVSVKPYSVFRGSQRDELADGGRLGEMFSSR